MRTLALLAAAAATLLAGATVPYVRSRTAGPDGGLDSGHCLAWRAGTVELHPNLLGAPELGDAGFAAIDRSIATWAAQMGVCGNLTLRDGLRSPSRSVGFIGDGTDENVVIFRTRDCLQAAPADDPCHNRGTCANAYDCWDFAPGVLAITTTSYDSRTGHMFDADIELNASEHTFTTVDGPTCPTNTGSLNCADTDVQNTVTHEMGHALGLAHSPDPLSTMYGRAERGEISKRLLDDGSKEFVCSVYPKGQPSQDCDGPSLDITEVGSSCSAVPMGPLGLLALAASALRRRRWGE
jgi:MYXO-CTERM domain-containing protein